MIFIGGIEIVDLPVITNSQKFGKEFLNGVYN